MKLFMKKNVIIVQVNIQSVVHYSLQNFRETQLHANWPIICHNSFWPHLKFGVTVTIFIFPSMPKVIDFFKVFKSDFFIRSYTDLIIFASKPS